jgi:hypothetical protein
VLFCWIGSGVFEPPLPPQEIKKNDAEMIKIL